MVGTGLSDTSLKGEQPRTIHAKFALIWFCSFRGEYLNAKACDVRRTHTGRKVMARVHMTRRANKVSYWFFYLFNNINVNSYEQKKSEVEKVL